MKFGLDVPTTGEYADARVLAQLAVDAEHAGWDGFFIWDVLPQQAPVIDPWIALTAIALQTSHIKIGLLAIPLARHRPYLVAQRLANLDQLSHGRMICTVGLGFGEEVFAAFGEERTLSVRARQLEEGMTILAGLWTGDPFSFTGEYYALEQANLHIRPVQEPRIPLWVAGGWPNHAPFRRAVQWDGACLKSINAKTKKWLTVADFQECLSYLQSQRTQHSSEFDIIVSGETPNNPQEASKITSPFAGAGATWWVEEGLGWSLEEFRQRIRSGPPCS
ncbi:LLM class flavin-dependent oxidoreductase [Tengunoibacter tsumagoiensis]|uniref:Luciferase-like protein n=1 Tax=Tengunoibacter tsumagoiensis TaxID=2014871 RepID=A0A402A9V0_9CHLR|nr:LLM class flavin-dependent oxidoreductase [Tengunoibacter tsumagoiensis]GCE15868.1 luciferase-like protein [Tengunoibacter tsumagoiensis]